MLHYKTSSTTSIDLRSFLASIPMNAGTVSILDDFCKQYAEYRFSCGSLPLEGYAIIPDTIIKPIIEKALNGVLYYVFWRTNLTGKTLDDCKYKNLVKPFTSEDDAIKWICQNGRNLIDEYDMEGGFLYIHEIDHGPVSNGNYYNVVGSVGPEYDIEDIYKIFAFTKGDYKMLLNDHITRFVMTGTEYPCIPYWIHYVDDNNDIKIGLPEKYYQKLYYTFELGGASEEFLKEFAHQYNEFNNNPQLWIEKYVDGDEELTHITQVYYRRPVTDSDAHNDEDMSR